MLCLAFIATVNQHCDCLNILDSDKKLPLGFLVVFVSFGNARVGSFYGFLRAGGGQ